MDKISIFLDKPTGFSPQVEVAGSYLMQSGKLLLLKRSSKVSQPGTWGVPAGKLERGESPIDAAVREVVEETGMVLNKKKLEFLCTFYIKAPVCFAFHTFYHKIEESVSIALSDEHIEHAFFTLPQILEVPLIRGGLETIKHIETIKKDFWTYA